MTRTEWNPITVTSRPRQCQAAGVPMPPARRTKTHLDGREWDGYPET